MRQGDHEFEVGLGYEKRIVSNQTNTLSLAKDAERTTYNDVLSGFEGADVVAVVAVLHLS